MRQSGNRPGALVPPAVPDPLVHRGRLDPDETARSHHLEPGRFLLYSGNLDGYQELDILSEAAARLASRPGGHRMPLVIASHSDRSVAGWSDGMAEVEFRRVASAAEMQALLASARASLLLRRTEGGFPIKLVNSLSAGTPVIAFQEREWGLEHEVNSLIGSPSRPVESLVASIDRIEEDDLLAHRLARGARELYLAQHQGEPAAKQVLALVEKLARSRPRR
jgi:glycosyltransferase involved in cell wall biosynthesis